MDAQLARARNPIDRPAGRLLRWASALYLAGLVIHLLDHVRRGTESVTPEVLWAGVVASVAGVAVVLAIVRGVRGAVPAALAFGLLNAAGVAAVHIPPHWSVFSDAFWGASVSPLSWFAVLTEIAGSLAMAAAAAAELKHPRSVTRAT